MHPPLTPATLARSRSPSLERGFTLLEVLLVVLLIALVTGVLLPNVGFRMPFQIERTARVLGGELQSVQQRAIATGTVHRWAVDLDNQVFRVEEWRELPDPDAALTGTGLPSHSGLLDLEPPRSARSYEPISERAGDWHELDGSGVWIHSVSVGNDERTDGEVTITFAPDGGSDGALFVLADEAENRLEVELLAFTGEVRVLHAEE